MIKLNNNDNDNECTTNTTNTTNTMATANNKTRKIMRNVINNNCNDDCCGAATVDDSSDTKFMNWIFRTCKQLNNQEWPRDIPVHFDGYAWINSNNNKNNTNYHYNDHEHEPLCSRRKRNHPNKKTSSSTALVTDLLYALEGNQSAKTVCLENIVMDIECEKAFISMLKNNTSIVSIRIRNIMIMHNNNHNNNNNRSRNNPDHSLLLLPLPIELFERTSPPLNELTIERCELRKNAFKALGELFCRKSSSKSNDSTTYSSSLRTIKLSHLNLFEGIEELADGIKKAAPSSSSSDALLSFTLQNIRFRKLNNRSQQYGNNNHNTHNNHSQHSIILDAIAYNKSIKSFQFESSDLGMNHHHATSIAKILTKNNCITELSLCGNHFDGDDIQIICHQGLRYNNTLKSLFLDRNPIGDDGIVHLANVLSTSSSLTTIENQKQQQLEVKNNSEMIHSSSNNNNNRETVKSTTLSGGKTTYQQQTQPSSIEELTLIDTEIWEDGCIYFSKALCRMPNIKKLSLDGNGFEYYAKDALLQSIKNNHTITRLFYNKRTPLLQLMDEFLLSNINDKENTLLLSRLKNESIMKTWDSIDFYLQLNIAGRKEFFNTKLLSLSLIYPIVLNHKPDLLYYMIRNVPQLLNK